MNNNKGKVIGWVLVGVVAVGVAGFFGVRSMIRAKKVKPFETHLDAYMKESKGMEPTPGQKLAGKLITVDINERKIDYLYFDLPDNMRADNPEEVGTIVQLNWGKNQVGEYTGGKPAWKQYCFVSVMDKASGKLFFQNVFEGSDPPSTIKSSQSSGSSSKPSDEIVAFLKGLPHD